MKKYRICLILFLFTSVLCLCVGFFVWKNQRDKELEKEKQEETQIETTVETTLEIVTEEYQVANQEKVAHESVPEEAYCLVVEDGFLLVFLNDRKTICLYTHVPIVDFPMSEQEKLRAGIWFPSMIEVFNYLESYTS